MAAVGDLPADSFLPTRQSLLSRLRSWDDQDSWRQFFETYWRLIYDVARKAGLDETAAQDVVQETVLAVAKQMPGFRYDRSQGSFKGWLLQITRRRVADSLRQQYRHGRQAAGQAAAPDRAAEASGSSTVEPGDASFDALWDAEWAAHLTTTALNRVRARVNPLHYQVYDLVIVQGWPPAEAGRTLGVNLAQVYLIRSRVGRLVREELAKLDASLA